MIPYYNCCTKDNADFYSSMKMKKEKNNQIQTVSNQSIRRKLNKIRNNGNSEEEDNLDTEKELTRSLQRIKNMENDVIFNIGYMGEAYVYKNLNEMKCFSEIVWEANTSNTKNPLLITVSGRRYYINEDGGHFDILAKEKKDFTYYFEVKSSCGPHPATKVRNAQLALGQSLDPKKGAFILARVSNVFDTHEIEYYLLINGTFKEIKLDDKSSFIDKVSKMRKKYIKVDNDEENDDDDSVKVEKNDDDSVKDEKNDDDFYNDMIPYFNCLKKKNTKKSKRKE